MPEQYHGHPDYAFDRNFQGYGEKGLTLKWPNNAKIAVSFVINYEEVGPPLRPHSLKVLPLTQLPTGCRALGPDRRRHS